MLDLSETIIFSLVAFFVLKLEENTRLINKADRKLNWTMLILLFLILQLGQFGLLAVIGILINTCIKLLVID